MPAPVTPKLTVDIIIRCLALPGQPLVLIERKHPPLGWALPGGFVDIGETVEQAAVREALEETCCQVQLIDLLGVYSDPARDARGHTVSVVFMAQTQDKPQAADDAKDLRCVQLSQLPDNLAFDHGQILADYRQKIEQKS